MSSTPLPRPTVRTEFLSAGNAARLVSRTGVIECLRRMADAIEADFSRWRDFDKSARIAAHSPSGVIELMPVADAHDYAFKYVNGHPVNTRHGLPTVMAFGALADVATGAPRFLSELTLTTALRTAATSLVAARRLARSDSTCMALIGNGSQSEFQALAFIGLLGIRELRLFDTDPAATAKLMRNIAPWAESCGAEIRNCPSVHEAVRGADIVTTLTAHKSRATVFNASMLAPGMHINAVGGDCPGKTELTAAVLKRSSVFVEYEPQTRIEGELQQMPPDFPVTELWEVIAGHAQGRTSHRQVTLFDSVGFALEDYSALRTMQGLARGADLLETIDLIPELHDPKDLFAMVRNAQENVRVSAPLRRRA